jgi:hypothetical protein
MGVLDIFSARNKPLPDVYVYDELPQTLRVQIVHILQSAIGPHRTVWTLLADAMAREHGLLELPYEDVGTPWEPQRSSKYHDCLNYVLQAPPEHALDLVELAMSVLDGALRAGHEVERKGLQNPDDAIAELNVRFRRHGVGYQLEGGHLVRVDSQHVHAEAVRPALALLSQKGFEGPNQEFLTAYEHFRHGRVEDAMTNACKAFESTMKAIFTARKWPYDPKDTAKPLIKQLCDRSLVPSFSQEQLENVAKCLLGPATVRNKSAGHGAGAQPRDTPVRLAAYALHLAASNIVFLVECHRDMP